MTGNTSTALITGGTSGIGRATANKLAQIGIQVVVVGRNAERGKKTVEEIRAAGAKESSSLVRSDLMTKSSSSGDCATDQERRLLATEVVQFDSEMAAPVEIEDTSRHRSR